MIRGVYHIEFYKVDDKIPTIFIKHDKFATKKLPAVILMHGLSSSKERNLAFGMLLANEGFLVAMPDAHMHGDRSTEPLHKLLKDKPLETFFDILSTTVDDIISIIDYLEERDDVQKEKIGMTGISMGGILTFMAGLADERIKVMAPIIASGDYLTAIKKSTLIDELGIKREVIEKIEIPPEMKPILEELDPAYNAKKLYPRPLIMVTGGKDTIIPKEAVENTVNAIRDAYKEKPHLFKHSEYPNVGHNVTEEMLEEVITFLKNFLSAKE
ncbi:MAG: prolyl oligopeptidase family serine peptidase [Candidatus Odinarchaeota archaeon]|nr:prolyl oligopeptidase family serine peptidase [Candidatus Odinarchaeota archaeon]